KCDRLKPRAEPDRAKRAGVKRNLAQRSGPQARRSGQPRRREKWKRRRPPLSLGESPSLSLRLGRRSAAFLTAWRRLEQPRPPGRRKPSLIQQWNGAGQRKIFDRG